MTQQQAGARRPLKSRNWTGAKRAAAWLAPRRVSPNAISVASIAMALVAAAGLLGARYAPDWLVRSGCYLVAILGIQGHLICNLLDGMVAVEGGLGSKSGELYNDLPDRLSDPIILVAAGYAANPVHGPVLGWTAALLAVITAYVRVLGKSIGSHGYFIGPMAKQHRMAVVTACCALSAAGTRWSWDRWILDAGLVLIAFGCLATIWRRLCRIVQDLEAK